MKEFEMSCKLEDFKKDIGIKELNYEKILELQNACLDREDFICFIGRYFSLETIKNEIDISKFDRKLSFNEFKNMPFSYAKELFSVLGSDFIYKIDSQSKLASTVLQLVLNGQIEPSFLIKDNEGKYENDLEKVRNNFFRRLYGFAENRGFKGVLQSHYICKAYIKMWISFTKFDEFKTEAKFDFFSKHPSIYDEFVMRMGGGMTIFALPNLRDVLVAFVVEKFSNNIEKDGKKEKFNKLLRKIGIESITRSFEILPSAVIKNELERIFSEL